LPKPPVKREEAAEAKRIQEALAHPLVQAAFAAFPGAKLERVVDRDEGQATSDSDDEPYAESAEG
jgi:hypothetical protein